MAAANLRGARPHPRLLAVKLPQARWQIVERGSEKLSIERRLGLFPPKAGENCPTFEQRVIVAKFERPRTGARAWLRALAVQQSPNDCLARHGRNVRTVVPF